MSEAFGPALLIFALCFGVGSCGYMAEMGRAEVIRAETEQIKIKSGQPANPT